MRFDIKRRFIRAMFPVFPFTEHSKLISFFSHDFFISKLEQVNRAVDIKHHQFVIEISSIITT